MAESPRELSCANCISKMSVILCEKMYGGAVYPCSCAACLKLELKQCSGCKVLKYCSEHCQKEHWLTGHRKLCKVLAGTKRLEPLRHEVNSCLACTEQAHGEKCSSIRHRKEIVWNYFRFFGCQVGKKPGKSESEFPWQCPFQLGECTGRFVNWIDESLWRLISLLRLTLRAEEKTLRKNSEFPQALDKLERAFWSLRKWCWIFATVTTNKNRGTLEYLFSNEFLTSITIHSDYIDENDKNFTPMLNLIIELNQEATSLYWNSFIDFAALFVEKLRTKKYDVLNLGSIPEQKKDRFKELLSYDRLKTDFKLEQTFDETEAPPDFSILLPPRTRCFRCKKDLGGRSAQLQVQFPHPSLKCEINSRGRIEVPVRYPDRPVVHEKFPGLLVACGDDSECKDLAIVTQLTRYCTEGNQILEFLSHSWLCNGCLRYSMKTHKCSKCKSVLYCSQDCLEQDWKNHKYTCAVLEKKKSQVKGSRKLNEAERERHGKHGENILMRWDMYLYRCTHSHAKLM